MTVYCTETFRQVVFNMCKKCDAAAAEPWVMKADSLNCLRRNGCVRFFFKKFQRAITPQWEITVIRKIRISYFLMRYPYNKFQ